MNVNIATPHLFATTKINATRSSDDAMQWTLTCPPSVCYYLAERDSRFLRAPGNLKPLPYVYIYMYIYIYMYVCYIYIILYIKCHPWHGNPVLNIGVLDSLHQATIPAPRRHVRRAHRPSVWVWLKAKLESQRDSIVMSQWISWLRKLQKLLSIVG